jgi:gliding motility-associated-like protein
MDGVTLTGANVPYTFDGVDFYNVSLTVTNEFGCTATSTWNDYIEVVDVPNAEFYINPNPTTIFNTTVDVNPVLSGSEYTYYWSAPEGIPSTSTEESPRITFPEGIPGIYEVALTVTNEYGCFYTVKHTVSVESDVIIYAPNIFTPDGDFYNETWRVHMDGIDIYDFHLRMYNRWGETVWESFDAEGVWDGTYGGNLVQDGTYIWVINVKESTNDRIRQFTGTVNVLK